MKTIIALFLAVAVQAATNDFTSPAAISAKARYELAVREARVRYKTDLKAALRTAAFFDQFIEARVISEAINTIAVNDDNPANNQALAGEWRAIVNGKDVGLCKVFSGFVFVNEAGKIPMPGWIDSGVIHTGFAPDNLRGTITRNGQIIEWSNNTQWQKAANATSSVKR